MAFAVSCLLSPSGQLFLDPDSTEENDCQLNISEHLVVYDPEDFDKSIAMSHFGKFELEAILKVSRVMFDSGILAISEEIKSKIVEDIEAKL